MRIKQEKIYRLSCKLFLITGILSFFLLQERIIFAQFKMFADVGLVQLSVNNPKPGLNKDEESKAYDNNMIDVFGLGLEVFGSKNGSFEISGSIAEASIEKEKLPCTAIARNDQAEFTEQTPYQTTCSIRRDWRNFSMGIAFNYHFFDIRKSLFNIFLGIGVNINETSYGTSYYDSSSTVRDSNNNTVLNPNYDKEVFPQNVELSPTEQSVGFSGNIRTGVNIMKYVAFYIAVNSAVGDENLTGDYYQIQYILRFRL